MSIIIMPGSFSYSRFIVLVEVVRLEDIEGRVVSDDKLIREGCTGTSSY